MKEGSSNRQPNFNLICEFTDGVSLTDFMKIKGMQPGMLLEVDMTQSGQTETLLVGNCTAFSQPSTVSHDGWDWNVWSHAKVIRVFMLDGNILDTTDFRVWKENVEATFKKKVA